MAIVLTNNNVILELSTEIGLEIMSDDEYLEVTPQSTRLRKQVLKEAERAKTRR